MIDHTFLLEEIRDRMQTAESDLAKAKEAAAQIPEIEAEIERLDAAMKALGSPQTPSGRKRIGDGAAKRRKPKPEAGAAPMAPQCAECRGMGTFGRKTEPCTVEGCEAHVCGACQLSHQTRWHREYANA